MTDKHKAMDGTKDHPSKSLFHRKGVVELLVTVLGLVVIFAIQGINTRFDLTEDQRYSLSEQAKTVTQNLPQPVVVHLYLGGELPFEFARLRTETQMFLSQIQKQNPSVEVLLHNPWDEGEPSIHQAEALSQRGMNAVPLAQQGEGKSERSFVFPWAELRMNDRSLVVSLLKSKLGATQQERINLSVQELEYKLVNALSKISVRQKSKIAILKGNGELPDAELFDFLNTINDYYGIAPYSLDSSQTRTEDVLSGLKNFDLLVLAKPTQAFTEAEKYVLDQYTMSGGKSLWLVDPVQMELDSLFNPQLEAVALPLDLNLGDLFFRYGVRLNAQLVKDLYATPIVLANGQGNATQYDPAPWVYHPMVFSRNTHPINKNIEANRMQFAGTLDTLANAAEKTVLLQSSPRSAVEGAPAVISLRTALNPPQPQDFEEHAGYPLAVLIEGEFSSLYGQGRLVAGTKKVKAHRDESAETAIVVVADGDLIRNQLDKGNPLELGYDKWTNSFYGNKEFLLNTVNYLLGDQELLSLRNKEVSLPLLDQAKIEENGSYWQWMNSLLPLLILGFSALVFFAWRKKVY